MTWKEYYQDPFGFFDKTFIKIFGIDLLLFKYHDRLRKIIWWGVWSSLALWILMGFDSGYGQIEYALYAAKDYFLSPSTMSLRDSVIEGWNWAYGKTMHWSAFTIYGILYWATSWHLEKELGFTKTKNSAFSLAFTLFNIGVFEWAWMYCYAFFHDQWWSIKWIMPQARILIQNVGFTFIGVSTLILFWVQGLVHDEKGNVIGKTYSFKPSSAFILFFLLTIASAVMWVYYPWGVKPVETYVEGYGNWTNSNLFPQTLYTVDTNLLDDVNAGEWFYVQDDLVHFMNTGVKFILALTGIFYVRSWKH